MKGFLFRRGQIFCKCNKTGNYGVIIFFNGRVKFELKVILGIRNKYQFDIFTIA